MALRRPFQGQDGGADLWNSRQVMAGFPDTMEEAGAPVPVSRIGALNVSRDGSRPYFRQVMATSPTAVYFGNDRLARSFYMWAADVGLRIPQMGGVQEVGRLEYDRQDRSPRHATVNLDLLTTASRILSRRRAKS